MKRRAFIKSLGLTAGVMGSATIFSPMFGGGIFSQATAAIRPRSLDQVDFVLPTVMPQVINVFLYGGPSELAGNLTNIDEINFQSKNKYPGNMLEDGNQKTVNGFWRAAGGEVMERMLAAKRLSVYRTVNRIDDNSRAHRPSIFSSLTGRTGVDNLRPGIATNIVNFLSANNAISETPRFPLATFDGESLVFNQSDNLPLAYKVLALNDRLENPYTRTQNTVLGAGENALATLAKKITEANASRFSKVASAFSNRDDIDTYVGVLQDAVINGAPLDNPDFVDGSNQQNERDDTITYPNNPLGRRLKAAVGLLIDNPETLFVSLGTGGIGDWDDHNAALENNRYANRMQNLLRCLEVAAQNLEAAGKGNVVINVYGEFGRNANLNDSMGWDHGNCQNLYTVGANPNAAGVTGSLPGRVLGKIVGETTVTGDAAQNRLFTTPTASSYQCEPFAIAASVYKYFGVQNPEVLTGGYGAIDETGTENLWIDPNA